jgi:hypothetical protein
MKKINDEVSRAAAERVSLFLAQHNLLFLQLFQIALQAGGRGVLHQFSCFKPSRISPSLLRRIPLKKERAISPSNSPLPVQPFSSQPKKSTLNSSRIMRWRHKEYTTAAKRLKTLKNTAENPSEKKHEITPLTKSPPPKKPEMEGSWESPRRQEERQFQISRI